VADFQLSDDACRQSAKKVLHAEAEFTSRKDDVLLRVAKSKSLDFKHVRMSAPGVQGRVHHCVSMLIHLIIIKILEKKRTS